VVLPAGDVIQYRYDAEGMRVKKVDTDGTEIKYLMDGLGVLCEYEEGGGVLREYVAGVGMKENGNTYYYIMDRLENVRYVLDESGAIVKSYLYSPFGQIHIESGSLNQPYQYVGGEGYYTEQDINLQLLGQRWYDAEVGRFISRDPIGEEGGLNLYVYVGNSPIAKKDPFGLYSYADCVAECEEDYDRCVRDATQAESKCIKKAIAQEPPEIGRCLIICLPSLIFGPAGYGACVSACAGAYTGTALAEIWACHKMGKTMKDACKQAYDWCVKECERLCK